jgi:DNA-binding NarL/FixJ family response regulator
MDLTIKGGEGGCETLQKLLVYDPDVRAIVVSGYSNDPVMSQFRRYGFCGRVTKPFTNEQLLNAVDTALSYVKG